MQAQNKVVSLLKNRVVVGHGLSNDFEALMVSHPKGLIRDTALYEPLMRVGVDDSVNGRGRSTLRS